MAYDPALPTKADEIRFLIADTGQPPLIPDATIEAKLAEFADWRLAAADCAEALAVQLERDPTSFTEPGDVALGWGDRARSLRSLAMRLRTEVADEAGLAAGPVILAELVRESGTGRLDYAATRYRGLAR